MLTLSNREAVLHSASFAPTRLPLFRYPYLKSAPTPYSKALHLTGGKAGGFVSFLDNSIGASLEGVLIVMNKKVLEIYNVRQQIDTEMRMKELFEDDIHKNVEHYRQDLALHDFTFEVNEDDGTWHIGLWGRELCCYPIQRGHLASEETKEAAWLDLIVMISQPWVSELSWLL